jgi:hypothetical protein
MEIRAHLNEEELVEALGNPGKGLVAHLDSCDSCRKEVGRLRRALNAGLLEATPPEDFWQRQRDAIRERIAVAEEGRVQRVPRLAWAALAATVALGTLWMSDSGRPVRTQQSQIQVDDQELMIAVEHAVQSDVPEALEPASLLAQEISQADGNRTNSRGQKREAVNEN